MNEHFKPEAPKPRAISQFTRAIFKHRRIFIEAMVGTFVLNMIGLATALYSMTVYDRVIPNSGFDTLWVLTVGVLIAVILELVLKQVRATMVDRACKAIDIDLSDFFFTRALNIRMDARPRSIGTFAAQVRMFESVRAFMTSTTLFVLADIPFAVLFVGVIALIAGPVALVPLLLLPVVLHAPAQQPAKKLLLPVVLQRPAHCPAKKLLVPVAPVPPRQLTILVVLHTLNTIAPDVPCAPVTPCRPSTPWTP